MAAFFIQLHDKLVKISGDLTSESIITALGYTPSKFDGDFNNLSNSPISFNGGKLEVLDEKGNIVALFGTDGLVVNEVVAGTHKLTEKADTDFVVNTYAKKTEVPSVAGLASETFVLAEIAKAALNGTDISIPVEDVKVNGNSIVENKIANINLGNYATLSDLNSTVSQLSFDTIEGSPFIMKDDGEVTIIDDNGNIGFKLNSNGLYVKNVYDSNGKSLSTEDFTTAHKTKLNSLEPFDSSALETEVEKVSNKINDYTPRMVFESTISNLDFESINGTPFTDDESDDFIVADKYGNVGLKLENNTLYVNDVVSGEHVLSEKVGTTDVQNITNGYITSNKDLFRQVLGVKTVIEYPDNNITLTPNVYTKLSRSWGSFVFTLATPTDTSIVNEYLVEFTTAAQGSSVSLPSGIKWAEGITPTFEMNTTYQISIVNNLGIVTKFK